MVLAGIDNFTEESNIGGPRESPREITKHTVVCVCWVSHVYACDLYKKEHFLDYLIMAIQTNYKLQPSLPAPPAYGMIKLYTLVFRVMSSFFQFSDAGSCFATKAILELSMKPRLTSNSKPLSCLSLPSAYIHG